MPTAFVYFIKLEDFKARQNTSYPYAFIALDKASGDIFYYTTKDKLLHTKPRPDKYIVEISQRPCIVFGPSANPLILLMNNDGKLTPEGDQYQQTRKQQLMTLAFDAYSDLIREPVRLLPDKIWFYRLKQNADLAKRVGFKEKIGLSTWNRPQLHPAVK